MGWHFGQNCSNYLPTLSKCRVLAALYASRADLLTQRWCTAEELLVYAGVPGDEIALKIDSGEIATKRIKKDGTLRYLVRAAWDWDGCPLANDGGQCLHFEPHDGPMISCLKEIRDLKLEHPNCSAVPRAEDIAAFEATFAVSRAVEQVALPMTESVAQQALQPNVSSVSMEEGETARRGSAKR